MTRVLRVGDSTLAAFAVRSGSGRGARAALGAELDAGAGVLLLGDASGPGPDRTAAAGALLAITRRGVVVPVSGGRQHPINLGRSMASLSILHGGRVGVGAGGGGWGCEWAGALRALRGWPGRRSSVWAWLGRSGRRG